MLSCRPPTPNLRITHGIPVKLVVPVSPPAAPVFLTELQSQDVPDGYPVSFDCVVIGKPPPSVRWFKDGKLLEENDHYMINEDQEGCHQLIITTALPSDMGVYRCMAENTSGIATTKAELRVDSEYRTYNIDCPRVYWFKDGHPLRSSDRILLLDKRDIHSLEVLEVKREDTGEYSAYISNAAGTAYSSARLLVLGRGIPVFYLG
uniref:Ig-like domain-containing protein n=1 Tax=Hucho hucho TaxID=62062 RepID=A0A4W5L279_9TELE